LIDLWAKLIEFTNPKITRKRFEALVELTPKRICFSSTHRNALRPGASGGPPAYFNVPFQETIGVLFPWDFFKNKFGYSRTIKTEGERHDIQAWMDQNRDVVFIRSLLASCVAACEHQTDEGRSEIGELEYRAKWHKDGSAEAHLADVLADVFERLHGETGISTICSVPCSNPGSESLPTKLAARLADRFGLENITHRLGWRSKKETIKDKEASAKWQILEEVGVNVEGSLKGARILIVDDMYQSGATVHFLASCLQGAGADEIHCLAVSKSRGDKDNV